jgi:hypothetical protein
MQYVIHKTEEAPELNGEWRSPVWEQAEVLHVDHFHERSSDHRPKTAVRLLYDENDLHILFHVKDRYVLSQNEDYQSSVCQDACVEFFFSPKPESGNYFNIEVNCGGAMLFQYGQPWMEDPRQVIGVEHGSRIDIYRSMPATVDPEIEEPTEWVIQLKADLALFTEWEGLAAMVEGTQWSGNFYKCASSCSHPHWASWAPMGEVLNFHQPEYFQPLLFADE